jgi:hypothetical protein
MPASRSGVPVCPRLTKVFPVSSLSCRSGPTASHRLRSAAEVSDVEDGDGEAAEDDWLVADVVPAGLLIDDEFSQQKERLLTR